MSRLSIWFQTIRPKTLPASLAPVIVIAGALLHDGLFRLKPFLLVLAVALTAQIASNVTNDYFDYLSGADRRRKLGPKRLITTGDITPGWMLLASIFWVLLCAILGIWLLSITSWWLLLVGILVIIGIVAYSAGPYPLSYKGFGDIAVILFYGIIPVLGGYYAIAQILPTYLIWAAFSIGFANTNILVINNYRDYPEDNASGKRTLVVRMGEASGPYLYLFNAVLAFLCYAISGIMSGSYIITIIGLLPIALFFYTGTVATFTRKGKGLNPLLGFSAKITALISIFLLIAFI